jgi:hypothetical protein
MICWVSFFLPCLPFYPVLKAGKPYISLALLNLNGSGSMTHWKDIQSVVEVTRKRTFKKKGKEQIEQEVSYYITSLGDDVKQAPGLSEFIGPSKLANIGCWT